VDSLGDKRAGAYTCADQALISRLHTRVAIATKTRAGQKAGAIAGRLAGSVATAEHREHREKTRISRFPLCSAVANFPAQS